MFWLIYLDTFKKCYKSNKIEALTLPLPVQESQRTLQLPIQVWHGLTYAVWGTSTFVLPSLKREGGVITTSQGPGAGPFIGPSIAWPKIYQGL